MIVLQIIVLNIKIIILKIETALKIAVVGFYLFYFCLSNN